MVRHDRTVSDPSADSRLALAYDAAKDVLSSQDQTLSNVRNRAGGLLSVATLLTSFSASLGLLKVAPDHSPVLWVPAAWLLLILLLVIGGFVLFIFWPAKTWHFGPSPEIILGELDRDLSEDAIRRHITGAMVVGMAANSRFVSQRQRAFRLAAVCLVVEAVILVGTLAVHS